MKKQLIAFVLLMVAGFFSIESFAVQVSIKGGYFTKTSKVTVLNTIIDPNSSISGWWDSTPPTVYGGAKGWGTQVIGGFGTGNLGDSGNVTLTIGSDWSNYCQVGMYIQAHWFASDTVSNVSQTGQVGNITCVVSNDSNSVAITPNDVGTNSATSK